MLNLLPVILLLCSGSVLAAALGRRAEEAMPLTAGGLIVLLYLFYAADRLAWGYWTAIALCCGCCAGAIFLIVRRGRGHRSGFLARLCTPGMAVFLTLCVAVWLLVQGNTVNAWDELRLWAAYPKALYVTERLQLGADALLYANMQSYPPGMALFCYFIEKAGGSFTPARLYWAYAVFGLMMALPALKNLRWKQLWMNAAALLLLFVLPMFFGNSGFDGLYAYRSLYIDVVLGLTLGCAVFLAAAEGLPGWFESARLAAALSALALLKDSGVLLAALALPAALLLTKDGAPSGKRVRRGRHWLRLLAAAALPLLLFGLWQLLLGMAGVKNHIPLSATADDAIFLPEFFTALLKRDIVSSPVFANWGGPELATYATTGALCLGLGLLTLGLFTEERRRRQKLLLLIAGGMNLAYIAGLYLLFRNGFDGNMPSYARYIGTIAQANITLIVLSFLEAGQTRVEAAIMKNEWSRLAFACALALLVAVFPLGLDRRPAKYAEGAAQTAAQIAEAVNAEENGPGENVRIYLAFPRGETDVLHHELYYALLDYGIRAANYYDNTCINRGQGANAGQIAQIRQKLMDTIAEHGCTYLYFVRDIPLAKEQLPELFAGSASAGTLYRIETEGGRTVFRQIGPA